MVSYRITARLQKPEENDLNIHRRENLKSGIKKFLAFMEPKGSLSCSQQLAISLHPEADESSTHPPLLFLHIVSYL
jgi:hypothetical protein